MCQLREEGEWREQRRATALSQSVDGIAVSFRAWRDCIPFAQGLRGWDAIMHRPGPTSTLGPEWNLFPVLRSQVIDSFHNAVNMMPRDFVEQIRLPTGSWQRSGEGDFPPAPFGGDCTRRATTKGGQSHPSTRTASPTRRVRREPCVKCLLLERPDAIRGPLFLRQSSATNRCGR